MKNRLLFEKIVQSIAPAVTKYHLELQLKRKKRDESEFVMNQDTPRFIAEDCADIAKAIVNELEHTRERSRQASVSRIMEAISSTPVTEEDEDKPALAASGTKPKSSSNGTRKTKT